MFQTSQSSLHDDIHRDVSSDSGMSTGATPNSSAPASEHGDEEARGENHKLVHCRPILNESVKHQGLRKSASSSSTAAAGGSRTTVPIVHVPADRSPPTAAAAGGAARSAAAFSRGAAAGSLYGGGRGSFRIGSVSTGLFGGVCGGAANTACLSPRAAAALSAAHHFDEMDEAGAPHQVRSWASARSEPACMTPA